MPEIPPNQEERDAEITPEQWEGGKKYYQENRERLIQLARLSRELSAFSYRGFVVGATTVNVRSDKNHPEVAHYETSSAGNVKLWKDDSQYMWDKRCAEINAIDAALVDKAPEEAIAIAALITIAKEMHVGDPKEPTSTQSHDILHTCHSCRMVFRELLSEGVFHNDTIICNARDFDNGTETKVEERTLGELLALYKDDPLSSHKA